MVIAAGESISETDGRDSDGPSTALVPFGRSGVAPPTRVVLPPRVEPPGPSRTIRRIAFLSTMAVLLLLVPALVYIGASALTRNDGVASGSNVGDPSAPGYEAVVTPTDTMLVIMAGPDDSLSGMAVLAGAGGGGGTVLLVPAELEVALDTPRPRPLADIASAEGFEGAAQALAADLALGFDATVVLDEAAWISALQPLGSLTFENPDDLISDSERVFAGGELTLEPAEMASYLAHRNVDEDDERARLFRQELVWQTWMNRVGAAESASAAVGGSGELAQFIGALAGGPIEVLGLPIVPVDSIGSSERVRFNLGEGANQLLADAIPFPTGSRPGQRIGVKVLAGTGDREQALAVAVALVPHGAEVLVIGNADRFDYGKTVVRYRDPAAREAALAVAEVVGAAETTLDATLAGGSVVVTVIVGADVSLNTSTTRNVPSAEPTRTTERSTFDTLDGASESCEEVAGCDK